MYNLFKAMIIFIYFVISSETVLTREELLPFEDGQKIVFYGDSITHGGYYEYYVQLFYSTRFPDRKITIENAGIAGATACRSLFRLEQDVLSKKPDIVYIMFGMNDVGRSNYKTLNADERIIQVREKSLRQYTESLNEILKKIKEAESIV